ncbi:MAG: aldo/keto reductase [Proteobacteria bacterium]|nr:aldo/keto reductase [Pseudomonadota bacterium]
MEYVNLGNTGLMVSRLCLGCMTLGTSEWRKWVLDERDARGVFKTALDAGINYFDTADQYSQGVSEEVTGRALRDMARRDEFVVSTKVNTPMGELPTQRGLSRKHIMEAIDASLMRLGLDYVDLYVCHRWDETTPIEETLAALDDVIGAGKALYIGASNFTAWQLAKALGISERQGYSRFITLQNIYNLIDREDEREMAPLCRDQGVAMTPWSPLARGFLAGNRKPGGGGATQRAEMDAKTQEMYFSDTDFAIADRAGAIAKARDVKPIQVALAWLLAKPGVTSPVVGVTKKEQLGELIGALDIELTAEEMAALEEPYLPKRPYR